MISYQEAVALEEGIERMCAMYNRPSFVLPEWLMNQIRSVDAFIHDRGGIYCHGDAWRNNFVLKHGRLHLIDFDDVCYAPSSYDYVTMHYMQKVFDYRGGWDAMLKYIITNNGEV